MKGIILDDNGDLVLANGSVALGDADGQTIENILRANRGEFKEAPYVGGEVIKILGGTATGMWCATVKEQMQSVGIKVKQIVMAGGEIVVTQ